MLTFESDVGHKLCRFADDLAIWSRSTFGGDHERGPIGALKHLELEVQEVIAAPDDRAEYADCLILIVDAARRAGMTILDLVEAATKKMNINKQRKWPTPSSDEPVCHIQ